MKANRTVNHEGIKATVCDEDDLAVYTVSVNGRVIGKFVFSDGHHGGAAYSNGYGVDCYMLTNVGPKCVWGDGPLYSSIRQATIGLIERAMQAGIIN